MKALNYRFPHFLALWVPLLMVACGKESVPPPAPPPPPVVTVEQPKQQDVTSFLELSGKTRAFKTIDIRAQAEGYLLEVHFRDGALVNKGDLLFSIDPKPYEAGVKEAEAALAFREAEKSLAEKVYNRRRNALADNAVSELAVEESQAQLDLAIASIASARAQLDRARLNLSYTRVEAPMDGRMSRRMVDVGNLISMGESPVLATLIAEDPIYVYFTLSEEELLKFTQQFSNTSLADVKVPVMLGLSNSNQYPYEGYIDYIDNEVDPATGTMQARAVFSNSDHELLPGLYARIRAPLEELQNAILTPETALGINQSGRFLILVNEENKAEFRQVTIGPLVDNYRVITSGLSLNDRVVTRGGQMLQPGMDVTVEMSPGEDSAAAGGTR